MILSKKRTLEANYNFKGPCTKSAFQQVNRSNCFQHYRTAVIKEVRFRKRDPDFTSAEDLCHDMWGMSIKKVLYADKIAISLFFGCVPVCIPSTPFKAKGAG
jgi:hypothetical protein